jgi:hypothetical protein
MTTLIQSFKITWNFQRTTPNHPLNRIVRQNFGNADLSSYQPASTVEGRLTTFSALTTREATFTQRNRPQRFRFVSQYASCIGRSNPQASKSSFQNTTTQANLAVQKSSRERSNLTVGEEDGLASFLYQSPKSQTDRTPKTGNSFMEYSV